jgi:indolepyruvate ferredoxin oxidoreductase beta subunit
MQPTRKRLTIAILALGGQGGGVLAEWIQTVARAHGWYAQGTSVPGVAQRTGSTVYYVELFPAGATPVMAQMPVPGDVDVVIASELMETGRAMLRGFSTRERTILIGSTHRIYAISEKTAMGDGRANSPKIVETAGSRSKQFIGFDMEAAATKAGSVISSVMLGALAGSAALPFARDSFEEAIRHSGIAIDSNLRGFSVGFAAAQGEVTLPEALGHALPVPTTEAGRILFERIETQIPRSARENALHGVQRAVDYQSTAYAHLYLDRLKTIADIDDGATPLVAEAARHLALWMTYEDTIRVADLKTRGSRNARVRKEVLAKPDQIMGVTEFMHPRLREVCETLPASLGRAILNSGRMTRWLSPMFASGRHVETTRLRWFLALRFISGLRPLRPSSLRYQEEQARIEDWLDLVRTVARSDRLKATELVRCQRLIKGYGDTFERGLHNFNALIAAFQRSPDMPVETIARLRHLALKDETSADFLASLEAA